MAISIVNSATIVNTTISQAANYNLTYTVGSGSGRALAIFCLGLKSTNADSFATNPMAITVGGVSISDTQTIYAYNTSVTRFASATWVANPASGSQTINVSNSMSFRCLAAYVVELQGVDATTIIGSDTTFMTSNGTTISSNIVPSPAVPGMILSGLTLDVVSSASQISAGGGATLITATDSPGSAAANDDAWAVAYKVGTGASDTHSFSWTTSGRAAQVAFYFKADPASGINKFRVGSTTPTKFYVGSTQVTKAYVGSTNVLS